MSVSLGDTKEVNPDQVCYTEIENFIFAKHCDSGIYSIVVPSENINEEFLNVIHLYDMKDVNQFLDVQPLFEMDGSINGIFFNGYPDSIITKRNVDDSIQRICYINGKDGWFTR